MAAQICDVRSTPESKHSWERVSARANEGIRPSVLRRIDKETDDGLFAKRLGSFQPV
jgi:hypothetical protein